MFCTLKLLKPLSYTGLALGIRIESRGHKVSAPSGKNCLFIVERLENIFDKQRQSTRIKENWFRRKGKVSREIIILLILKTNRGKQFSEADTKIR